jgi:4-hydroxy-tetrahydrodipicolinate reductase
LAHVDTMRIVLVGNGRMGQSIAALAPTLGHSIHVVLGSSENVAASGLTKERLAGADIALEFTRPESAPQNIEKLMELGLPTVTGTTGWQAALPRISALVDASGGTLLHAANFSVGVHLFLRTAENMAKLFRGRSQFTDSITEEHHVTKRDAPSGTALLLQRRLSASDPEREFPITSVREGSSIGTHRVGFLGSHEELTLSHVARDRHAFATGALMAAEWLVGKTGIFTFDDVLFGGSV